MQPNWKNSNMANQANRVAIFTVVVSLAVMINYADRSIISTAIIYMAEEFTWNESTQGTVLTGFFIGYAVTQSFGGYLSDRFDSKFIIIMAFTLWCGFTIVTPFSSSPDGILGLMIIRIVVGLAEGLLFPAIHSTISRCIPYGYQSTVVSIMTSASYFGVTAAFFSAPYIADAYGWREIFYIIGGAGIPWLPIWIYYDADNLRFLRFPRFFNNKSEISKKADNISFTVDIIEAPTLPRSENTQTLEFIPKEETKFLGSTDQDKFDFNPELKKSTPPNNSIGMDTEPTNHFCPNQPLASKMNSQESTISPQIKSSLYQDFSFWKVLIKLLSKKQVWAILIGQYANSFGILGIVSWLPTFMKQEFDVTPEKLSLYTSIPYIGQTIFGFAAGFIADYFIAKNFRVLYVRHCLQTSAMLIPAIFLFCMVFFQVGEILTVIFLFIGCSASALSCASISVNQLDICPQFAGFIFGMGSASGVIAAIVAVPLLGFVIQATQSWFYVFSIFSIHYLIGNFFWLLWASDKPLIL